MNHLLRIKSSICFQLGINLRRLNPLSMSSMSVPIETIPETESVKRKSVDETNEPDLKRACNNDVDNSKNSHRSFESKRRKIAMLISYSGKGYLGMQRNPGAKTIEEDILSALLKLELIRQEDYEIPQQMHFQRAARTDKGVSASRQVISLRLPSEDDIVEKLNGLLPDQIRVFDIKRTTRGFNSKLWCDFRTYSYTLPTFAFTSVDEVTTENYKLPEAKLEEVNELLGIYKGTHNFHNFTSGKKFSDKSAIRYMMNVECGKPFVREGMEFATINVKGQSFMLHQIRKMIGLVIAIARGMAATDVLQKAWNENRVDVPIAPGLGLVLEEVHYEKYNTRYGSDGMHEILVWDKHKEALEAFREKFVFSDIIKTEIEEKSMLKWLDTLNNHTFDVRDPSCPSNQSGVRTAVGMALVRLQVERGLLPDNKLISVASNLNESEDSSSTNGCLETASV